jgi:hypothetical protein
MTVVPANQVVAPGSAFVVEVHQNADATSRGAQMNFTFDPAMVQVTGVVRGPKYATGRLLAGVGQTLEQAIAEANTTGTLKNVSTFLDPGQVLVTPGDTIFVSVAMQAKPGVTGSSDLALSNLNVIASNGSSIPLTSTNGTVNVDPAAPTATVTATSTPAAAAATSTATPTRTATITRTPTASPSASPTFDPNTADAVIKVDPEIQTIPPGSSFTIDLVQDTDFETVGAFTYLEFNHDLLEIERIAKGDDYATGGVLVAGEASGADPQTVDEAIDEANGTGLLKALSVYFATGGAGTSRISAGEHAFAVVTMKVKSGAANGTTAIEPIVFIDDSNPNLPPSEHPPHLLDEGDNAVRARGEEGEVVINSGAPTPTVEATSTPQGTATVNTTATVVGTPTVDPATADAFISVSPATITVPPGAAFTVQVMQNAEFVTTGAQADIKFDTAALQMVSVQAGPSYQGATLLGGVAPQTLTDAVTESNTTGLLKNVATFFVPGTGSVPAGETLFLIVNMQAKAGIPNASHPVELSNLEMLDEAGNPLTVAGNNGTIVIDSAAPVPTAYVPPAGSRTSAAAGASRATGLPRAGWAGADNVAWLGLFMGLAAIGLGGGIVAYNVRRRGE